MTSQDERSARPTRRGIRIAYVIDGIVSPNAGTEKYLCTLLQSIDRSRFDPTLCVLQSSRWLDGSFDLCPVHVVGCRSLVSLGCMKSIAQFSRYLRKAQFDIVQTHFPDGNVVGSVAARLARVPVLVSSRRNQGYWHNRRHRLLLSIMNSWATCFLANAEATAAWAMTAEGISRERCMVIPNGVDIELYRPPSPAERQVARSVLGLPQEAQVVVTVANLRPVKALEVFLAAMREVAVACPDVLGVIAGGGPEEASLRRTAASLGIEGRVTFLGSRDDVPRILWASDVGVLSSDSESSSNAVVEYMAAGLPVVCTDVGGAREVVSEGVSGYVVPRRAGREMADRLVRLITGGRAADMGLRGREHAVERYSLRAAVRAHESLYRRLAGQ